MNSSQQKEVRNMRQSMETPSMTFYTFTFRVYTTSHSSVFCYIFKNNYIHKYRKKNLAKQKNN